MGHSEIGKPEKCGGVGSRIQVLVAVFDDRGVLSMFVELTVARRAPRDFRLAPGRQVFLHSVIDPTHHLKIQDKKIIL